MIKFMRSRIADERGVALPMVIGITVVLALLVTTAVAYSTGGFRQASASQQWSASLAAAYAGIEEYQSRLSEDTSYIKYGNPGAAFSTVSGSSVILPTGSRANPAFNVLPGEPWAVISGGDGGSRFRYEVDNSKYSNSGIVRIRSTGSVGGESRSIVADLRQDGFIDFLYFTDYEITDPAYSTGGAANASCVEHWWSGRDKVGNCGEISFGFGDTVDGPVHSNDTIRICEAEFLGDVTTSYQPEAGQRSYKASTSSGASCNGQIFKDGEQPSFHPVIGMPATNSEHLRETRSDLAANGVPRPGCLYTGPTKITLLANGKIKVISPWTIHTRIAGSPATSGTNPPECGTPAQLSSGNEFTLPANNVIYVQNVPLVNGDPNYWGSKTPDKLKCVGADGSKDKKGNGNGIGYPMKNEEASSNAYGCKNGDLFVEGTLKGQATLSAEHYVYVTGDIIYNNADDDVMGLVGNDAVWVWNPVNSSNKTIIPGSKNRRIDSAILSVAHTFAVQNPGAGSGARELTINGAIAQKFRGIVKSGSGGFTKDYRYDTRLRFTAPPKFLSPVTTTYGVNVWIEVDPAYDSNGAPTL